MAQGPILNSWKEIALYMGRAVRTVQRWEEDCQLPIHRPRGTKRSAVFALPDEIDHWLQKCPVGGGGNGFGRPDGNVRTGAARVPRQK